MFGLSVPCVAGEAIFGILLNLLLSIGKRKKSAIQIQIHQLLKLLRMLELGKTNMAKLIF